MGLAPCDEVLQRFVNRDIHLRQLVFTLLNSKAQLMYVAEFQQKKKPNQELLGRL
jgi:hypothetical protein